MITFLADGHGYNVTIIILEVNKTPSQIKFNQVIFRGPKCHKACGMDLSNHDLVISVEVLVLVDEDFTETVIPPPPPPTSVRQGMRLLGSQQQEWGTNRVLSMT